MQRQKPFEASYILPIATQVAQVRSLSGYLRRLSEMIDDVVVMDGSPQDVFDAHACAWSSYVRHLRPEVDMSNGKVAGVMAGIRAAHHDSIIIADDDVRYRRAEVLRMLDLLREYQVVRPQNVFFPMTWHARWDTGRSLLNRVIGGDWPGTLGIRGSKLLEVGGYSGEVLFENFELVRTLVAAGGRESVPLDLYVTRRPPSTQHFFSQRLRQAYDEWARPGHFVAQLALLPGTIALSGLSPGGLALGLVSAVAVAELGRRKAGGPSVYGSASALWAPAWLAERAVTSWMAFGTRLFFGGVRYGHARIRNAATPKKVLIARLRDTRTVVR